MPTETRLRLQIRVVQVVFRAESFKLFRIADEAARREALTSLRDRSLAVLAAVRTELDGTAPWHQGVTAALDELSREMAAAGG